MTRIKDLRTALGMTQAELADKMGVSQTTVAMWETGDRTPRTSKLLRLAEILNCSVSDLFSTDREQQHGYKEI